MRQYWMTRSRLEAASQRSGQSRLLVDVRVQWWQPRPLVRVGSWVDTTAWIAGNSCMIAAVS